MSHHTDLWRETILERKRSRRKDLGRSDKMLEAEIVGEYLIEGTDVYALSFHYIRRIDSLVRCCNY